MRIINNGDYKLIEVSELNLPQDGAPPVRYEKAFVFVRKDMISDDTTIYDAITRADMVIADGKIVKNRWA